MRAVILSPVLVSFLALTGCIIYIDNGGRDGRDGCGDGWDECDDRGECDESEDWDDDWVDENGNGIHDDEEDLDDDPDPWDECQRVFDVTVGYDGEASGWLAGSWDAGWHGAGFLDGQWSQELGADALVTGTWGREDGSLTGALEGWIFTDDDGTLWLTGWAWSEADYIYFQAPLEAMEEGAEGAGWWSFAEAWLEGVMEETGLWTAEGLHNDFPAHAEGEFLGDCDEDAGGGLIGHYMADSPEAPVEGPIDGSWYEWEAGQSWGWDFGVGEWGWYFGSTVVGEGGTRVMGGDGFPFSCQ